MSARAFPVEVVTLHREQLAARRWVDDAVGVRPLADLRTVQEAQLEFEAARVEDARVAETAAAWITSVGRAAAAFLSHHHSDERGVVVAIGADSAQRFEDEPHMAGLAAYGDEETDFSLVTVWQDLRLVDALGENAGTAEDAFRSVLDELAAPVDGLTEPALSGADVGELAAGLSAAAKSRAEAMREEAVRASARAEAATWRLHNPADPAEGLSREQADLIIVLSAAVDTYRDENGGRDPLSRNPILVGMGRGPLNQRWTKDRAIKVGESIFVPWPLPGTGAEPSLRQLYIKGARGRVVAGPEMEEARVLVEGAHLLLPLAEQVFADPSG